MKKVLSLVLSLVMLLGLVVPVSAEDTYPGNGTLKDKTAAFTIEADKTTLYGEGEQIVRFHIYAESKANVPIRAFQFTLEPSANLTLATELAADNAGFNYAYQNAGKLIKIPASNPNGMYELFEYKPDPDSRYFGAAGTDEDKGITARTEVMTIMGKVNGVGEYTLSMTGVVAGNGDAPDKVTQKFTSTVAGATVTVKPGSEQPQPNLSLTLSKSNVNVGDTFTATLSNKGMNIISIIAQMRFNKDVLEVVSITENEGYANLASGAAVKVRPTVDEANTNGVVGMSIANTAESWYPAKDIVTVTFKAKAAGDGRFELVESTDGTDGYHGDNSGGTVTVEAAAVTGVTVTAYSESLASSYSVNGQTVTVTYDKPCKVGYLGSDGKYVAISAVASGSSYAFTAPDGVTEVVLVIKGDVNGDGEIKKSDITRLNAAFLGKTSATAVQQFAGDIVEDGGIKKSDITRLNATFLGKTALTW